MLVKYTHFTEMQWVMNDKLNWLFFTLFWISTILGYLLYLGFDILYTGNAGVKTVV